MRRGGKRRKGRSGQGSRRLKDEVIRPDAYRLKDNDDDVLSKRSEQLCRSFLSLSFSFCLLSKRSYKSTPTRTLFGPVRSGAPIGGTITPLFSSFTFIWKNSFLPEQKGISFF